MPRDVAVTGVLDLAGNAMDVEGLPGKLQVRQALNLGRY